MGHEFSVSGALQSVYGTIAAVSADNPASNALGGFKEGFTAFRHCRQCMGTSAECKHEVSVSRISLVPRPYPAHVRRRGLVSQGQILGLASETCEAANQIAEQH